MSDYGFKTHDDTGKIAINAKNPIFGFDMGHNPRAFKTFRFTDAKESPIRTGSVATPNPTPTNTWGWAQNTDGGVVKELIKQVKHGYNFRPVGYAVITGTWKTQSRVQITQTQRAGSYGGNYTRTFTKDDGRHQDVTLIPNPFNYPWDAQTGVVPQGATVILDASDFSGTNWAYEYPKNVMTQMAYGRIIGDAYQWKPDRMSTGGDIPIWVEFDDEYIYFYRQWTWSDTIRRCKFTWNWSTSDDIQERVKVSAQFVGSVFNVTVYLCPFPLKELL